MRYGGNRGGRVGTRGEVLLVTYINIEKKKYKSVFDSCIKIRRRQLAWIKENKDTETDAGFLDKVINYYKDNS